MVPRVEPGLDLTTTAKQPLLILGMIFLYISFHFISIHPYSHLVSSTPSPPCRSLLASVLVRARASTLGFPACNGVWDVSTNRYNGARRLGNNSESRKRVCTSLCSTFPFYFSTLRQMILLINNSIDKKINLEIGKSRVLL